MERLLAFAELSMGYSIVAHMLDYDNDVQETAMLSIPWCFSAELR